MLLAGVAAMVGDHICTNRKHSLTSFEVKRSKMPKLKTKSGVKKRFRLTAKGKVRAGQAGKRHGMIKRGNRFIRNARGSTILSPQDARIIKKFMPYG
jgi:large subunit ribosomal protein L35